VSCLYRPGMRLAVAVLAIVACSPDRSSPEPTPAPTKPVTKPVAIDDAASNGKLEPIGALAPQPPTPTPDAVAHRACGPSTPVELGTTDRSDVAAAFGPKSGIVAWSPSEHQLAIRAVDRSGKPLAAAHVVDAPARLDSTHGVRALDGYYIVFVSATDFSGSSPVMKLYALLTDADGRPSSRFTKVAIGDRGMIDDVSPGAARGVLVWAGPTPATHIDKGRLISLTVDGKGALAQAFIDFDNPAPGDRARAFFSFGDRAVVLIGPNVIVDGAIKPRKNDASYDPDGLTFAPTFTGNAVPVLGLGLGKRSGNLRYGALGLDGAFHFDKADVATTKPLHAPFEDRVGWGTSTSSSGVDVVGMIDSRGVHVHTTKVPPALAVAGLKTEVVWSGDQILVLVADGRRVRVAPLPCT
jgi:hypothetical protein